MEIHSLRGMRSGYASAHIPVDNKLRKAVSAHSLNHEGSPMYVKYTDGKKIHKVPLSGGRSTTPVQGRGAPESPALQSRDGNWVLRPDDTSSQVSTLERRSHALSKAMLHNQDSNNNHSKKAKDLPKLSTQPLILYPTSRTRSATSDDSPIVIHKAPHLVSSDGIQVNTIFQPDSPMLARDANGNRILIRPGPKGSQKVLIKKVSPSSASSIGSSSLRSSPAPTPRSAATVDTVFFPSGPDSPLSSPSHVPSSGSLPRGTSSTQHQLEYSSMPRNWTTTDDTVYRGQHVKVLVPRYSDGGLLDDEDSRVSSSLAESKQKFHSDPNLLETVILDDIDSKVSPAPPSHQETRKAMNGTAKRNVATKKVSKQQLQPQHLSPTSKMKWSVAVLMCCIE